VDVQVRGTYFVATFAIPVLLVCLSRIVGPTASSGPTTWWVLAASTAISALLMLYEWRRDRAALAMYGAFWSSVVLVIVIVLVGEGAAGDVVPQVIGFASVAALVLAACLRVIFRERRRVDEAPDHMVERFGTAALLESEGVVWTIETSDAPAPLLGIATIFVQNDVAAARRVQVETEDVHGLWNTRGALAVSAIPPLELAPGELASCRVAIAAGAEPAELAHLYFTVRASGGAGRRVRKQRGRAASGRTTIPFQILAFVTGHLVWGGGVRATLANPMRRVGEGPPPSIAWRVLASDPIALEAPP
jgi:hypothetical protein